MNLHQRLRHLRQQHGSVLAHRGDSLAVLTVFTALYLLTLASEAAAIPPGLPPGRAARALEKAIRHGQPVTYDGNVKVEALAESRSREIFIKSTAAPLDYDPDPAVPGDEEYFRLPTSRKGPQRVKPIPAGNIIAVKPLPVVKGHPPLTVVSHVGIVTLEFGLLPTVQARLSDGSRTSLFVGLTTEIRERIER